MISEPMLVYYLKFFRDVFWPGGRLAPPSPPRTEEEMEETKSAAKAALNRNIPGEHIVLLDMAFICQLFVLGIGDVTVW